MTDYKLMALEMANDDSVLLRERIASLEDDVETYKVIVKESLTAMARLTAQLDAARREIRFLKTAGRAA